MSLVLDLVLDVGLWEEYREKVVIGTYIGLRTEEQVTNQTRPNLKYTNLSMSL